MEIMKIKKALYLIALVVFSSHTLIAQKSNETIVKEMAKQIFVDINNKDYDAILDMTYPKIFDMAPREQMKSIIKSTLEGNNNMSIDIPKTVPDYKLTKIVENKEESLAYAFLSYDMSMKMTFFNQTFDDNAKQGMKSMMQSQGMDAEFISDNSVKVIMNDRVTILIKDKTTKDKWAIINYDPSPMISSLLPSEVVEAAKKYQEDLLSKREKSTDNKN